MVGTSPIGTSHRRNEFTLVMLLFLRVALWLSSMAVPVRIRSTGGVLPWSLGGASCDFQFLRKRLHKTQGSRPSVCAKCQKEKCPCPSAVHRAFRPFTISTPHSSAEQQIHSVAVLSGPAGRAEPTASNSEDFQLRWHVVDAEGQVRDLPPRSLHLVGLPKFRCGSSPAVEIDLQVGLAEMRSS